MTKYLIIFVFAILKLSVNAQVQPIIEFVEIPAGTFIMGSDTCEVKRLNSETQHNVFLSAFKMSKYEITFSQYDIFCEATDRCKPDDSGWGRENRPVINVSWHDANDFAIWMGCRLPTEAEWEYACRAGTTTTFNTGDCINTSQANFQGGYSKYGYNCSEDEFEDNTKPVGSYKSNAWGLYDMHGNVSEWCNDWFDDYNTGLQKNPKGPLTGEARIIRGGNWIFDIRFCRSARRSLAAPDYQSNNTGFRIVL